MALPLMLSHELTNDAFYEVQVMGNVITLHRKDRLKHVFIDILQIFIMFMGLPVTISLHLNSSTSLSSQRTLLNKDVGTFLYGRVPIFLKPTVTLSLHLRWFQTSLPLGALPL